MKTARIIRGAAAAALVLSVVFAAGTPPRTARGHSATAVVGWLAGATGCPAPGHATEREADVWVRRKTRRRNPPTALKAGDVIRTGGTARGAFCLRSGWRCDLLPNTTLTVLPPRGQRGRAVFELGASGYVTCSYRGQSAPPVFTPQALLLFSGDVATSRLALARTERSESTGGKLFAISVERGQTVVKVRRGLALLTPRTTATGAVVLGRGQQARAPRGAPPRLERIPPTRAEKASLNRLEKALPRELDKAAPPIELVRRPSNPSSLRTTRFEFRSEPGAVFSCALDGEQLRLCSSPVERLVTPGTHTFRVRATDAAGRSAETSFTWTVDGSRMAFTSQNQHVGNREIYAMDPEGGNAIRLTRNTDDDDHPEWSPDGLRIAWSANRLDAPRRFNQDVYTMDARNGSDERRLTEHPATDRTPTWSPDGGRIVFESTRDGNPELYVMNADGTAETRLTDDPHAEIDPAWSPDGRRIAFASNRSGNYDIYVMDVQGGGVRPLTNDSSAEFGPSWSPEGTRIVFHGRRLPPFRNNLYVVDVESGRVDRLAMGEAGYAYDADDEYPTWAPDGVHIAFMSTRQRNAVGEPEYRLFILHMVSGAVIGPLEVPGTGADTFLGPNLFPAWSRATVR